MSEYNIQMNKYNALNVEYDQLYPATKIENVDGLNTALAKKMDAVTQAEHELSFADGWHMSWAGAGFSKSQDGQVTLRLNAYRDTPVSPSEGWVTVATLPAGFRPSYFCASCMGRCGTDGSGVGVQVEYTGEIKAIFIVERDNFAVTFTFVARN